MLSKAEFCMVLVVLVLFRGGDACTTSAECPQNWICDTTNGRYYCVPVNGIMNELTGAISTIESLEHGDDKRGGVGVKSQENKYSLIVNIDSSASTTLNEDGLNIVLTKGFSAGTSKDVVAWQVVETRNIHEGTKQLIWGETYVAEYTTKKEIGDTVIIDSTKSSPPFGPKSQIEVSDSGWGPVTNCKTAVGTEFCIDYNVEGDPLHLTLADGRGDGTMSPFFYDTYGSSYGQKVSGYVPVDVTVSIERSVSEGQFIGRVSDDRVTVRYGQELLKQICVFGDTETGGVGIIQGTCAA